MGRRDRRATELENPRGGARTSGPVVFEFEITKRENLYMSVPPVLASHNGRVAHIREKFSFI